MFKAATFNANSLRARLDIVLAWLSEHSPDVLTIQETKAQDVDFPAEQIEAAGYHVAFKGQKSYNGVAIISKEEPKDVSFGFDDGGPADEARLIRADVAGIKIVNTYVPQGTAVDDPRFQYKLEWFARMKALFEKEYSPDEPLLWMGDLNVAPLDSDVHDPKKLEGSVCFHPDEKAALKSVCEWGLEDVFRKHCSDEGQFTFWDYRVRGGLSRNVGWRLDHILATAPLAAKSVASYIDKEPRRKERPSDHTFLIAEFDL